MQVILLASNKKIWYNLFMEDYLQKLKRAWFLGDTETGIEYLNNLLRIGTIELTEYPLDLLRKSSQLTSILSTRYYSRQQRHKLTIFGQNLADLLQQFQDELEPFWVANNAYNEGYSIINFFNLRQLPAEQAEEALNIVLDESYQEEDSFEDAVVWYPDLCEIHIFVASEYGRAGDLPVSFSSGRAETVSDIPLPTGVFREIVFKYIDDQWKLTGISVLAHEDGFWITPPVSFLQKAILFGQVYNTENMVVSSARENYLILQDEITPSVPSTIPTIVRGYCEDYPACGHDICPPRWSHTGRQVAMICAVCGGEMPLGPSSIHSSCFRSGFSEEDYYDYGYEEDYDYDYDEEEYTDEEEYDEEDEDYE